MRYKYYYMCFHHPLKGKQIEKKEFNFWHLDEVYGTNTSAYRADKDESVTLTGTEATHLIMKWNSISQGTFTYWL